MATSKKTWSNKGTHWAHHKYDCIAKDHKAYRKEYNVWKNMHARCEKPSCEMYKHYGARGIKVCDRWSGEDGFINFYRDMGARPTGKDGRVFQIDRIDNDGDYKPNNCRWVHPYDNARNRSDNIYATIYGEKICKQDVCKLFKISRTAIERHMNQKGEDIDTAIMNILRRKGYALTKIERII